MKQVVLVMVAAAALVLAGCENKNAQPQSRPEEPAKPLTQMDNSPPAADPYASEAMSQQPMDRETNSSAHPAATPSKTARSPREETVHPKSGGGHTYVVQKGDTLSGIAKKVYGDASKWKKIWDANKAKVPNKDKLAVGTKLVIP